MKEKIKSFFKNKQNIKKILLGFALVVILVISIFISLFINKINDYYPKQYVKVDSIYNDYSNMYLTLNDDNVKSSNILCVGYSRYPNGILKYQYEDEDGKIRDSSVYEYFNDLKHHHTQVKYTNYKMATIRYKIIDDDSTIPDDYITMKVDSSNNLSIDFELPSFLRDNGETDPKDAVSEWYVIDLEKCSLRPARNDYPVKPNEMLIDIKYGLNTYKIPDQYLDYVKLNIDSLSNQLDAYYQSYLMDGYMNDTTNTSSESEENPNQDSDGFIELPNELEIDN